MRQTLAVAFTTLFIATAFSPLVGASTEATHNGDVIVNGAFKDARPVGHPLKFYCGAYNPTPVEGPGGECATENTFVAFDWTTYHAHAPNVSLVPGGIRMTGSGFIQHHVNGSDAPDRAMRVFHLVVEGRSAVPDSNNLRLEIRTDGNDDGVLDSYWKLVTIGTSPTTIDLTAAAFGIPAGVHNVRSVRLWTTPGADITLSRVALYATNGIDARNLHITPAGDDVVSSHDGVMLLNPGTDGKYSFLLGMAADNGDFLPTQDAYFCAFTAEQTFADRGFPENTPDTMCVDGYITPTTPGIVKTRVGDAFRIDVPAAKMQPAGSSIPAVTVYGIVKVDASYDIETPGASSAEFKSGYFTLARMASDALDAGVSQEDPIATPIFLDANADGRPDYVQTQDTDGYSVIITPQLATITPAATVVTSDTNGDYIFDIQVYKYEGATGAPMDLTGSVNFGLFDASGAVQGGGSSTVDLWRADSGSGLEKLDAKTWRVRVPLSEISSQQPLGAWAFYNVNEQQVTNVFGRSTSSTDFYSAIRNAVKDSVIADGMRTAMTPIFLDPESTTRDATLVIRLDADADDITPLDGTLVVGDKGDGTISFEYAMVIPEGRTILPSESHALAIYDAGGAASDDFAPGGSRLEHALWTGVGSAQADGWFRVDVPRSVFADAKGAVGAWAYTDARNPDGFLLSRSGWYNLFKGTVASISTSAAENALGAPTPIVLLDAQLGIPAILASSIAGAGTDLLSVTNPLMNPGFEADILVEGHNDAPDSTGGVMTAPPWFLRLDDMGTGQPTNPSSTHSVAPGAGRFGNNALKVNYRVADQDKSLMLGQILGEQNGGDAIVWRGARDVQVDAKLVGSADIAFTGNLRYLKPDGTVGLVSQTKTITGSGSWSHLTFALPVASDAKLLGFYLVINGAGGNTVFLDNVVLSGAQTAMGDARSDVSDGYAVIINPFGLIAGAPPSVGMSGVVQGLVEGVDDDYYVYFIEVANYTSGGFELVDLAGKSRSFALRTEELQHDGGIIMNRRSGPDATSFGAIVPAGDAPLMAAPWAFVDAGDSYVTLGSPIVNQPASGHYNEQKNRIRTFPFADQLDYAATPLALVNNIALTWADDQVISLVPVLGGYEVSIVGGDSFFAEETILTVARPGSPPAEYPVILDSLSANTVPGLLLTDEDLDVITLSSSDTRFTRGATVVAGSPIASFDICAPAADPCTDAGILTGDVVSFVSTSVSPTGEPLTLAWNFGDGASQTTTATSTTHAYALAGTKTVTLTVTTPSGKQSVAHKDVAIANRGPSLMSLTITPTNVYTDTLVRAFAQASDADGGTISYAWTIDGTEVPGATSGQIALSASVLEATTGVAALQKRDYTVGVTASDGQGGLASLTSGFTVLDRPASLSTPSHAVVGHSGATYALEGESVAVSTLFADADDVPDRVTFLVTVPGGSPSEIELASAGAGAWTGSFVTPLAGDSTGHAIAYLGATILATSPASQFETRVDSAPLVTIAGAAVTQAGSAESYSISAVDPDGRGIASFVVSSTGAILGPCNGCDGPGPAEILVAFDDFGSASVSASATDATGATGSASLDVVVDDIITVTVEMIHEATTGTESHILLITVTDIHGAPVAGATVVVEDFYTAIGKVDTQTTHTDNTGTTSVRMRPEGILIGLPFSRHVVVTVTADSALDAPIQDEETASAQLAFRNEAGPLGGLPLP